MQNGPGVFDQPSTGEPLVIQPCRAEAPLNFPGIPTFDEMLLARENVYAHLEPTPLIQYSGLCELLGTQVWIKHENHHAVGAFKVRGGVHLAMLLKRGDVRPTRLVSASTGNHGQSIAFAGRVSEIPVTIIVPEGANQEKCDAMRRLGAEVIPHGPDYETARHHARNVGQQSGAAFVGPADPELIAGVGTYTLEIMEALPDVDVIIVPFGMGSGACSVCLTAKSIRRQVAVIAVQSTQAPAAQRSWTQRRVLIEPSQTRAEGVATSTIPEPVLRFIIDKDMGLDDFVLVDDDAMDQAIRYMIRNCHSLAEHAGAAPLAAALSMREKLAGKKVVLVQSGGNLSMQSLASILT